VGVRPILLTLHGGGAIRSEVSIKCLTEVVVRPDVDELPVTDVPVVHDCRKGAGSQSS
jgi:hypothetical protein